MPNKHCEVSLLKVRVPKCSRLILISSFFVVVVDSSQNPRPAGTSVHDEQLQLCRGEIACLHGPGGGVEGDGRVQKLHHGEQLLWLQPGPLPGT